MDGNEKDPLVTREQLIQAIKKHFVKELKVDEPELIAKFLSLKKEERDRPMRGANNLNQRNNRPRREVKRTVDFTPTGPGGGPGGLARKTTPFNLNADATTSKACLLYTSPSPRDKRQSRMPSSA